ncbi:uncharacterized protein [Epargyreus clarus]|uniref:uncharacterized protein n=1 Tax=Epargyreus clarus TaxID=520877 RepID=UPI003C2D35B7
MSKCKKVKNPCKICLAPVTQKTGLQCQGACECWVHYTCLNYTPGKIKDIKAGIIKVTCPCPDCKSTLPKEFRTDEPFSCGNLQCPANHPPKCGNAGCPINQDGPDKMNQTSATKPAWPPSKCGPDCKEYSHPNVPGAQMPEPSPVQRHPGGMPGYPQISPVPDACLGQRNCPSGCSSSHDVPGDYRQDPMDGLPSLGALEQMCQTVGQLTNQINCLMQKMKQSVQDRHGGGCSGNNCPQKGTKSMCPKPCYCPDYEYSVIENKQKMTSSIKFQLLIVACINIGQIIVGYSVGWSAPIIPKLQNPELSPLPEPITDLQASWVGSLLYIGAMIGPYATAILSNLIGRKPCLLIGGCLNILAYILVITTNSIAMVFALRVISGLGMGITIVGNIVYVGEIASTHIRGILLTSTSIVGITGTLIVYAIVPYVSYIATGYIALAVSIVHVIGICFIPESPVYYAMKEETIKATKTLNYLGRSADVDRILDTFALKKEKTSKIKDWSEIFTYKSNRRSLFITFTLGAFQQTSGVAVVLFFATTIFDLAGSTIDPNIATIIIGVTRLVSSLIAPTFVERSGRKILLLISMAACSISLSVLGVYFHLDKIKSPVAGSIGWLPLVALIVYFFCYEAGFGTIPNAIVGEMFRPNVRANGSALAITLTWLVGFGLTTSFTTMVETLGGDITFWIFGGSCVLAFFFTLLCLPETKGKTLKEIQDMMINIGQFIDGYSVGWSAPIIPKLQDPDQTPLPGLITELQVSWIGPYIPSYLSNIIGRKPCLFLGSLLNLTAIILIVTTRNVAMVFAIRIISGLGMGMVTVSNLVYVGEIASTNIRGILLTSTSIVGIFGTLVAYAIGPYVSYAATGYIPLIINLVHLAGILFIPESPVYYAIRGKETEAKETLRLLGRVEDLENVFESVKGIDPNEGHSWKAWIKIFTVKANRWSLFITLSLCTLQQTSGVAAVLFFATTIFQLAGSSIRPDLATIIVGVTRLISSMVAPVVVERAGRRILLLVSTAFCACSLSILGTYFYLSRIKSPVIADVGWLPLLALIMYFGSYEVGFGTMPSALVGEMFKGNARSTGSAVAMTTAWLIGFGVASGFGSMVRIVGGDVTFWIFSCSCIAAFVFTFKFVPETKGKTLTEIQQILVYLGQSLVGFGLGWTAPIMPKLYDPDQSPLPYVVTETEATLIGSLLYIGTIIGPYISGTLSNLIGRKPCLLLGGSLNILAFVILTMARNLAMIFAGRILTGLGAGVIFITNLVYIGEIAPTNLRGILLTGTAIFSTFGTLLVYSIGPYFPYTVTGFIGAALTTIYCIGILFIPETPLFFVMRDDLKAAKQVLEELGRFEEIEKVISQKNPEEKISLKKEWTQIFTDKSNRKALIITLTLNILQQLSGVIVVVFFTSAIFGLAESSIDPNVATIVVGLTQLFGGCITPFFVERNGRKILLLVSTAFCSLSLAVLGVFNYLSDISHTSAAKLTWLPLVLLFVFFFSYSLGFAIIPQTFVGEMFQSNIRSTASTVTVTIGWIFGFGVTTVFGYTITALGGYVAFWTFAGACAVAFLFTLLYVPETKGKTLEEIHEMLSK